MVVLAYGFVILGAGIYWSFDYVEMLGGDPVLLALMLAGLVFGLWLLLQERRWLYLACGISTLLTPAITLFAFGAIGYLTSPKDTYNFAGTLVYLLALAVGVTGILKGYRSTPPKASGASSVAP